jgi:hypothetical protein
MPLIGLALLFQNEIDSSEYSVSSPIFREAAHIYFGGVFGIDLNFWLLHIILRIKHSISNFIDYFDRPVG